MIIHRNTSIVIFFYKFWTNFDATGDNHRK